MKLVRVLLIITSSLMKFCTFGMPFARSARKHTVLILGHRCRSRLQGSRDYPDMATVLPRVPAADNADQQHAPLYEQAPLQDPQHEREASVGANARTPAPESGTPQGTHSTSGKGGRPKSSVWKYFNTEGKRDDKSKREDVRCR